MTLLSLLGIIAIYLAAVSLEVIICAALIAVAISYYMDVPFVRTPRAAFAKIAMSLNFKRDDVVYELGSGDGRFLISNGLLFPHIQFIGIERNWLIHMYALFCMRLAGNPPNVTLRQGNFFSTDLSGATKIYAYLLTPVMDALLPKLEREHFRGRIASRAFQFKHKKNTEVVALSTRVGSHNEHQLYLYDF